MTGDVGWIEERLSVPRNAIRGGVRGTIQRHGQCIGREDLGSLCKRRVPQMQKIEFPSFLFDFVICVIYGRDLHDFPLRDIGSAQDSGESLLGRVACLLEPHFFVTLPVGFGNWPGTAENVDRAVWRIQEKSTNRSANDLPVLIVASYRRWYIRACENWQCTVRFWRSSSYLNVLIRAEPNIYRRVSRCLQQLGSWVFVEHSFTECAILFPLVASILQWTLVSE